MNQQQIPNELLVEIFLFQRNKNLLLCNSTLYRQKVWLENMSFLLACKQIFTQKELDLIKKTKREKITELCDRLRLKLDVMPNLKSLEIYTNFFETDYLIVRLSNLLKISR